MDKKVKNIFYNILTSGIDSDDMSFKYKLILVNSFLIFGGTAMFATMIHWIIRLDFTLIFIDSVVSLSFWILLVALRFSKKPNNIILASSIVTMMAAIGFLYVNKNNGIGIIWAYITIIYVVSLNGYKKGIVLSLIFFVILGTDIYIHNDIWLQKGWSSIATVRFCITFLLMLFISATTDYIFSKLQSEFHNLSNIDALTKVSNRRKLDYILNIELKKQQRDNSTLSFAILDIDNFKEVNDNFGHVCGDIVLKEFAKVLSSTLRCTDSFGRWGGEEFCVIMPNTNHEGALVLLEKLRNKICNYDFKIPRQVTCSIGVSSSKNAKIKMEEFIIKADKALYYAKHNGKNQVCHIDILDVDYN